jgi:hypothetical protein
MHTRLPCDQRRRSVLAQQHDQRVDDHQLVSASERASGVGEHGRAQR